jgi:uncharacterized membrane protein YqjE
MAMSRSPEKIFGQIITEQPRTMGILILIHLTVKFILVILMEVVRSVVVKIYQLEQMVLVLVFFTSGILFSPIQLFQSTLRFLVQQKLHLKAVRQ